MNHIYKGKFFSIAMSKLVVFGMVLGLWAQPMTAYADDVSENGTVALQTEETPQDEPEAIDTKAENPQTEEINPKVTVTEDTGLTQNNESQTEESKTGQENEKDSASQPILTSVIGAGYTLSNPAVEMRDGMLYCYDYSETDGFNSKGIRHASMFILPEAVSGSFTITAVMRPAHFYKQGTGSLIGIGAFAGKENGGEIQLDTLRLFTLSQRGDGSLRNYFYNGAKALGANGVNPKLTEEDKQNFLTYTLSWDGNVFTSTVDGLSAGTPAASAINVGSEKKNYHSDLSGQPFYLGLTFDGCDGEVQSLVIESEGTVLYDLSADTSNTFVWNRALWEEAETPVLSNAKFADSTITADWNADISTDGGDKLEIFLYHNDSLAGKKSVFDSEGTVEFTGLTETEGYYLQAALIRRGEESPALSQKLEIEASEITELKAPVVSGEAVSEGEIYLEWNKVPGAESYDVSYKESSASDYTLIENAVPGQEEKPSYTVSELTANTVYDFVVTVKCQGLEPKASEKITVTAKIPDVVWKQAIFGSSTSSDTSKDRHNEIILNSDGTVTIKSVGGAGKLQDAHDGIAYYYTQVPASKNFVLSADVALDDFGTLENQRIDKQNGFGLMARDVPAKHPNITAGNTSYGYSNTVTLSPYNTDRPVLALIRTGVASSITTEDQLKEIKTSKKNFSAENYPYPSIGNTYHMTMKKTNTGYHLILGEEDKAEEIIFYQPHVLETIDEDNIAVGFFTSRNATATFSNITFSTTNCADDPEGEPESDTVITPKVEVASAPASSQAAYELTIRNNVSGSLTLTQNGASVAEGKEVPSSDISLPITLEKGINQFELRIVPDGKQNLSSKEDIVLNFTVEFSSFAKQTIYVSPNGLSSNDGTMDHPVDLESAVAFAKPGQTIMVLGGTYHMERALTIYASSSGTKTNPIRMKGASQSRSGTAGKPVLDFAETGTGINLKASYWNISGLDVCNSTDNGLLISGSHNTVENSEFHNNVDTGLQITGSSTDPFEKWPANNTIKNCTSYDNCDAYGGNADGFAAKLSVGEGNRFIGCVAHHNSDDGWDLYARANLGPIGKVTIQNCIAYANGTPTDTTKPKGDGNGFKLGGEGIQVQHVIENCLSYQNLTAGFTANSNPGFTIKNCTSFENGGQNFVFSSSNPSYTASGLLSLRGGQADSNTSSVIKKTNYFWNGTESKNQDHVSFTENKLESVDAPAEFLRDSSGNLVWGNFLKPKDPSFSSGVKFDMDEPQKPSDSVDNVSDDDDDEDTSSEDTSIQNSLYHGKVVVVKKSNKPAASQPQPAESAEEKESNPSTGAC